MLFGLTKAGHSDILDSEGFQILYRIEIVLRFGRHCKCRPACLYGNHKRHERVQLILKALKLPLHPPPTQVPWHVKFMERYGIDPLLCPCCKKSQMVLLKIIFTHKDMVKRE